MLMKDLLVSTDVPEKLKSTKSIDEMTLKEFKKVAVDIAANLFDRVATNSLRLRVEWGVVGATYNHITTVNSLIEVMEHWKEKSTTFFLWDNSHITISLEDLKIIKYAILDCFSNMIKVKAEAIDTIWKAKTKEEILEMDIYYSQTAWRIDP